MINKSWEKDYPSPEHLTTDNLDENSSLKKMLDFIGEKKQVIDFGCATGYFANLLNSKGCIVTGVEINSDAAKIAEQYCKKVVVTDLDIKSISGILPTEEFDVAVFGDVLEHLRNPWKVLEETKNILKSDGYVVASIPNIAHGSIRLALLQGKFDYMKLGILDDTHLRFFTCKTTEELFKLSGYFIEEFDRTKLPIFSDSGIVPQLNEDSFSQEIIQQIKFDRDVDTLQFIVKAFPVSQEARHNQLLTKQLESALAELDSNNSQLQEAQASLENSQSQLDQKQAELEQSRSQLEQKQAELEQSQSQLEQKQAELEQSRSYSQQKESEFNFKETQLQQLNSQLHQKNEQLLAFKNEINIIETSKFWKMRTAWLKLKRLAGIKLNN